MGQAVVNGSGLALAGFCLGQGFSANKVKKWKKSGKIQSFNIFTAKVKI